MRGVGLMNTDIMALVKDIQDRVREVAYMMWESAGRQHGMAMDYWLQAEREVITTMQSAAERMMPEPPHGDSGGATPSETPAAAEKTPAAKPAATAKDKEPAKKPAARKSGTRASGKTTP